MKHMNTVTYKLYYTRPDITSGSLRIAFLTDLHNVENGPKNEDLFQAIQASDPDAVLCGGDMLVAHENESFASPVELLQKLSKVYPVYHGLGNHEARLKNYPQQYGPMYKEYKETLKAAGVIFLDSEQKRIAIRGIPVRIAAYSLPKNYYRRTARCKLAVGRMVKDMGRHDPKALNILMAHHPEHMEAYKDWGADLTLCGHFHGGMVRLGKHMGLLTPNLKLFNRFCCGCFDFHTRRRGKTVTDCESHVIVSAGLGEHTVPIRIHNPRELIIVDINIKN